MSNRKEQYPNSQENYFHRPSKAMKFITAISFSIYVIAGLALLYIHKPYLSICIEEVNVRFKIHIAYCAILAWLSIIISCIAIRKFQKDSVILEEYSKKCCEIGNGFEKIQKIHLTVTIFFMTGISFVAVLLVYRIAVDKSVMYYLISLAVLYIVTMITAYGYAVYIVNKIYVIFSREFNNYNKDYPIATKIFEKCYHIFFHGIVLFWIIGILLLILITLLCINENVFAMETQLNIFVLVVAYICIILGFILSTIYPYYITSRKIEELKLASIAEYLKNNEIVDNETYMEKYSLTDDPSKKAETEKKDKILKKNYADIDYKRIELIINSPNSIHGTSGIRVYSTLTVIVSLITQICSLYLLLKGTYLQ